MTLDLPVIHLDAEYWRPGWIEPDPATWDRRVAELVARDRWIMDGNYSRTIVPRVAACDTIVILDYSRFVCLYRVMKRVLKYRGKTRPDLHEGCPEKLPDFQFLSFIWTYRRRSLPKVMRALAGYPQCEVIVLKSPAATREWLARLPELTSPQLFRS